MILIKSGNNTKAYWFYSMQKNVINKQQTMNNEQTNKQTNKQNE